MSCPGLIGAICGIYDLPSGSGRVLPSREPQQLKGEYPARDEHWRSIVADAAQIRVAVVGIGTPRSGSFSEVLRFLEIDLDEKVARQAVGDIRFRLLNRRGETIKGPLEDLSVIGAEEFEALAAEGNRHVIGIASGQEKAEAIHAALLGRYSTLSSPMSRQPLC